jgi:membrane associated rhomboid family serine protease
MREEEKKMFRSLVFPFLFVFLLWVIRSVQSIGGWEFGYLGIYPRHWSGLIGIITSPLIHAGFSHLIANSVPLLVLGSALFYFYKDIALKVFILVYLFTGIWVWAGAREAYHIGASGVVYGLFAFIFVSGIIRQHAGLMSVAMIIAFLYGGMIWGVFPEFFPGKHISWESHLLGLVAGFILAVIYRKEGPQRKVYEWELEEDEEDGPGGDDDPDPYWNSTLSDSEIKSIKRIYRGRN